MLPRCLLIFCTAALTANVLMGAASAFAGTRPCDASQESLSLANATAAAIDIVNRRPVPVTVEEIDSSGAIKTYLAIAPGEQRRFWTNGAHAWISRDARRSCLSRFVPEAAQERWDVVGDVGHDYERRTVRSFPVYVAPEFKTDTDGLLQKCLQILEANAERLERIVPRPAWDTISKVPIWLDYKPHPYAGGIYYHSRESLIASGVSLAKLGSIQFFSSLPVMLAHEINPLLHELAHAYHERVLSWSYAPLLEAFVRAGRSGRYNAVRHVSGRHERAYAITNFSEFFAELSEAYFGVNDFFPFTRKDLKEFDPDSYRAVSDAWERPFEADPGSSSLGKSWNHIRQ